MDEVHRSLGAQHRALFRLIVEVDRAGRWVEDGFPDVACWLSARYDVSRWKARRWVHAAHALERLPLTAAALGSGDLGIDKVVELCRFADEMSERRLIDWAKRVAVADVRRKGDLALRRSLFADREIDRWRHLSCWYSEDGKMFELHTQMPAADGAIVEKALRREADRIPTMPDDAPDLGASAKLADALVAVCSARIGEDPDPDRATVVVHASLDTLIRGDGGAEIEDGPVTHIETVRRLLCESRVQTVIEDGGGRAIALGRMSRFPSPSMMRLLRHRDRGCTFPGCGTRRFIKAHHVEWWSRGGRTDLDNLVLVCTFHHKLVHELGWSIRMGEGGVPRWYRPDGTRYRAGPAPPERSRRVVTFRAGGTPGMNEGRTYRFSEELGLELISNG